MFLSRYFLQKYELFFFSEKCLMKIVKYLIIIFYFASKNSKRAKTTKNMSYNYSIIIPHKNIPHLLMRCLDSIPIEDDVQIIIVDDNSAPTLVDFAHFPGSGRKNTEVIFTKEGKGAGYARNVGLQHATGKWIVFADADDFFNDCFEDMLRFYARSEDDVVLFPFRSVNSDTLQYEKRDEAVPKFILNDRLNNFEKQILTVTAWSRLIKRECIEENHIRFEEVPYANDVMFGTQVGCLAKRITVDKEHYIYTVTSRSGSLITQHPRTALYSRLYAEIRRNKYLKTHHYKHLMMSCNGIYYLSWARTISAKDFLHTLWILLSNLPYFRKNYSYQEYLLNRFIPLVKKLSLLKQ